MFKQRNPRGFGLKGRYYDEDKARRDRILRSDEEEIPFGDRKKYRERLHENWEYRRSTNKSKNFTTRLIVIFAVLVALVYALLYLL